MPADTFTPQQIADRFGVGIHTVLSWLHTGALRGVNVARSATGKKPRWRITRAAVEAFELARSASPPPIPRRRKQPAAAGLIVFY